MAAKTSKSKPVFDIAAPGAPDLSQTTTTRPIIIKHATVQDPMVNQDAQPEPAKPAAAPQSPSSKKIVIQPLHSDVADTPAAPETVPEPAPAPEKVDPADSQQPVIDDEEATKARQQLISTLVASEEYFLPIETEEQRRSKRAVILGVISIVVLLLAWYNVSLDAGLLANTFNLPHTSFFGAR